MAANKYLALVAGKLKEVFASVTGTANAIPAGDATGKLDVSWMPTGIGPEVITVVASEALTAGNLVNIFDNAGTLNVRKADATTNAKPANGFVIASFSSAASATVYLPGHLNSAVTGLTIGLDYFLSTTPGGVTTTPPSATGNIVQQIGRADKTTEIIFAPFAPIEIG